MVNLQLENLHMKALTIQDFNAVWDQVDISTVVGCVSFLSFLEGGCVDDLFNHEEFRLEMSYAFLGDVVSPICEEDERIRIMLKEKWPDQYRWW